MLLLSSNGMIVPEPVKCCPGSAEGSQWTINWLHFLDERASLY